MLCYPIAITPPSRYYPMHVNSIRRWKPGLVWYSLSGFVFYDQHIPSLFPKLCTLLIYSHPLLPPFGLVEEQQEAKKLSNIKKLN